MRSMIPLVLLVLLWGCSSRPRDLRVDPTGEEPTVARELSYTVREGDTWTSIAESYFGDGANASRIAADNSADIALPPVSGRELRVRIEDDEVARVRAVHDARDSYNVGYQKMQEAGGDEAARESFERALKIAPHFVDARYNLGLVLLRLQRAREAQKVLEPVIHARPGDPDAHYALAAAYFHYEDFESALRQLNVTLSLRGDHLRALWTRALALQKLGRGDEAVGAWRLYLQHDDRSAWASQAREHLAELGG